MLKIYKIDIMITDKVIGMPRAVNRYPKFKFETYSNSDTVNIRL